MRLALLVVATAVAAGCTVTRPGTEQDLGMYIDTLRAIDSHAHPMAAVAAGAPADTDFDALPLDGIPPFDLPLGLRPGNPLYREAQRSLYGATGGDSGSTDAALFAKARARQQEQRGDRFPVWVLDQLHIDVMMANRIAMGSGLAPPRFRWVAFADPLMLPLDGGREAERTPDVKPLYPLEANLLRRYLHDLGIANLPLTLDRYVHDVVAATLEREHAGGAVAIKFEAAYLRGLDFEPADSAAAAKIYAKYSAAGVPTHEEYKLLQDYLVRVIAREAGQRGMAVQIHSLDGFGGFYSASGAAPHNLESLLNDHTLRTTRFVIVHGGWPLVGETQALHAKPNVYADISMMDQLAEPAALARTLRMWLAVWPEKVMFGTDAFDGGVQQGWEQVGWVATHNARRALADALSGMVRDNEITGTRARELARMVLHDNAVAVYRLNEK
jgi:predicted TIM-barrel fold metal-dependent hydrolase